MGKGQITADLGDGQYRVDLLLNVDSSEEITRIEGTILALQAKIAADPDSDLSPVYSLRIKEYQAKIAELEAFQDESPRDAVAWLADYPDDAPAPPAIGDIVGIVGIDREDTGGNLNIYPAFAGAHLYDPDRDGIMTPVKLMNPFWQFFNLAVSPGVQKWAPRFRHAEISDIDYDASTCTINIDPLYAAPWDGDKDLLWINQDAETLYDVPIDYMDCTTPPFKNFDKVLVEFTDLDWNQPVVKGYQTNPQPCGTEIVYVRLGPLGILWDITENDYVEGFDGTQAYEDCLAYLSGKTETTKYCEANPNRPEMPYKKTLYTFYLTEDYDPYTERCTTWGLPEHLEEPGFLYSRQEILRENTLEDGIQTLLRNWTECSTPWGDISPEFTYFFQYYAVSRIPIYGTVLHSFSSENYLYNYVCPTDTDEANFSYGTDAEYGNDLPATGYPGAVWSDNSIVQVLFSSHAVVEWFNSFSIENPTYLTPRETITHCTCGYYPWEVAPDAFESNPQDMIKNVDFSTAFYNLIEDLHTLWGVELIPEHPDYLWDYDCNDPGGIINQQCKAGKCNYWFNILNPKLELKLYRK